MAEFDALERLSAAGLTAGASGRQLGVLAQLSESEVAVLCSLSERLGAIAPDVQAHSEHIGATCW